PPVGGFRNHDGLLQMDQPAKRKMIRPSQGVHLVLDRSFLPGDHAIMIPKTSDGRVLFCVPWHDKIVVGTTDTLREHPELEPEALEKEIAFILETAQAYLSKQPQRSDVLSVYAGLRPLAAPSEEGKSTKEISRSHKIMVSASGLVTITGGKWTTFRKMGEDTVDRVIRLAGLKPSVSRSAKLRLHGYRPHPDLSDPRYVYGSDQDKLAELETADPSLQEQLHPQFPFTRSQVVFAVREEMARNVDDFLSRRIRILLLDSEAAQAMAPVVAQLMAQELGKDQAWVDQQITDFHAIVQRYRLNPAQI
ncbi:MAG: FAD-dependent oxidoreductase, partial [Bacteroidota bacterium]